MNRYLTYQEGKLLFEDVVLSDIAEDMYTPFYVYSRAAILEKVESMKVAFGEIKPMIAFSMNALDTTLILKTLHERGCSVAVENLNELERAISAGFKPTEIVLNSHGLPDRDLQEIIKHKPLIVNVGNLFELELLNNLAAEMDTGVRIGLRFNPGLDVGGIEGTNVGAKNSKIGIRINELDQALALIKDLPQLNLVGIAAHLGSQVIQLAPWIALVEIMEPLFRKILSHGFSLEYLDLGGGFPVDYGFGDTLDIKKIARNIIPKVKDLDCRVILEPGRYLTAEAGLLVTSVLGVKTTEEKTYVICDAGFAELPRSAMYRIDHEVIPLTETSAASAPQLSEDAEIEATYESTYGDIASEYASADSETTESAPAAPEPSQTQNEIVADIVGSTAEGLDYLARNVKLNYPTRGSLLAILNVGAYCRTMSSNYSSRLRPPEIMIERDKYELIRERETLDDLLVTELEESEIDS